MNLGRAFSFVFDDPEWVGKLLVGAVFVFLAGFVVGAPFLYGYQVQLARNVHDGEPFPLPAWSDLGAMFVDGLKLIAVLIVYAVPLVVVFVCSYLPIIPAAMLDEGGQTTLANLIGIGSLIGILIMTVLILVYSLLQPVIVLHYARSATLGEALRPAGMVEIVRSQPGAVAVVVLMTIVSGLISQFGIVLCFIGVYATTAWAILVNGHLVGQLWRNLDGLDTV